MNLLYDPQGGDLGRGYRVTTLELAVVVPHVANILQELRDEAMRNFARPNFKYGFEVYQTENKLLQLAIFQLERDLPKDVEFYQVDGNKIFQLRGQSGGVTTALMVYLVTK